MQTPDRIEAAARARIAKRATREQMLNSIRMANEGNPLAAEPRQDRLLARLQAKARLSRDEAAAIAAGIHATGRESTARRKGAVVEAAPERIYGSTIDFVGIAFLERGYRSARAVGRVAFRDGRPQGSGFLVSERLFLTNNHVISSRAEAARFVVEFDYALDPLDRQRGVTAFTLDPDAFFLTNGENDLDYTLVAIGPRLRGSSDLTPYGWCSLSDASDKHALGEVANVVQHPEGRYKEVVLRENRLVSRLDTVLHYVADTEPGSSGSPVFNNEWQVIALHHWGGPWRQTTDEGGHHVPTEVNEGIRTSAIVGDLRARAPGLAAGERALLERVFELGRPNGEQAPGADDGRTAPADRRGPRVSADGRITWEIPLEVSVRVGGFPGEPPVVAGIAAAARAATADAERKVEVDPDYENRPGYRPDFIAGQNVPLPRLSQSQREAAALNRQAGPGDDPFELRFQHFSVVVNARRRLAFFTACNIDGRSSKSINRKTGDVTPRRPGDSEALAEGAEASETWFIDPRLDREHQTRQDLYAGQTVKGFKKGTRDWMDRMFQRGHLVRRADPAWGSDRRALRADADTFHFVNCTPQVGFFNMGTASPTTPKSGRGQLWRALEDHVLENAVDEQKRVCVFTGPVLDPEDPLWRAHVIEDFRVPLRFWKLVAWADQDRLRALAMLADQEPVLKVMPEAIKRGEAFADLDEVHDFVTTVAELERVTGFDFGDALRAADLGHGEGARMRRVNAFAELPLHAGTRAAGRGRRVRSAAVTPRKNGKGK